MQIDKIVSSILGKLSGEQVFTLATLIVLCVTIVELMS
jgi:hypothetical protein